jgi:hypothetical protein
MPVIPAMGCGGVEIGRITIQGQTREKVSKTLILTNKPGMVVHIYDPSYVEGISRRIKVQS